MVNRITACLLVLCCAVSAQLRDRGRPYVSAALGYNGSGQQYTSLYPQYSALADEQLDMVQGENQQKFVVIGASSGTYDWTKADALHSWAKAHNKKIRCHLVPVWVANYPSWLGALYPGLTSAQLLTYATDFITAFFTRYRGDCYAADIANELFAGGTPGAGTTYWSTATDLWTNAPGIPRTQYPFEEGLAALFTAARAADPDVKLCYNEIGADWADAGSGKAGSILNMITMFQAHSPAIPINCVGLQFHINSGATADYTKLKAQMASYGAKGIETHITEMDVSVPASPTQADLDAQTALYAGVFQACLDTPTCTVFQTWGLTDQFTWLSPTVKPLLFDTNYAKKAPYNAIVNKSANLFPMPMGMHKRRQ